MSALNPTTDLDSAFDLDLDAARTARREALQQAPGIKLGGRRIELPVELPVDVLEPLSTLDMDVSLLIRQALDARAQAKENDEATNLALMGAVIDMLVVNPALPRDVVEAVKEMGRRLLGAEGYAHLVSCRLTLPDLGVIAKYLFAQYGVGLGESSGSSSSSGQAGTTSKPTSRRAIQGSTSATSGSRRTRKAS